jgi:hypothetical protein
VKTFAAAAGSVLLAIPGAVASAGVGVLVGYYAAFFVVRLDKFTIGELAELGVVLFAGAALTFVTKYIRVPVGLGPAIYALGVVGGSVLYAVAYVIDHGKWPTAPPFSPF